MYRNLRIVVLELAGIGKSSVGLANTLPAQFLLIIKLSETLKCEFFIVKSVKFSVFCLKNVQKPQDIVARVGRDWEI